MAYDTLPQMKLLDMKIMQKITYKRKKLNCHDLGVMLDVRIVLLSISVRFVESRRNDFCVF